MTIASYSDLQTDRFILKGRTMADPQNQRISLYYDAFLVRIWSDNGLADWRATVEHVGSGKRETFASVEKFITFMQKKVDLATHQSNVKETK